MSGVRASLVLLGCLSSGWALRVRDLGREEWRVVNANKSVDVAARVPGGIYSDLRNARVIGDPLYRFNDVLSRWVAWDNWTYSTTFNISAQEKAYPQITLRLHGLDTVADVFFNGKLVKSCKSMFITHLVDLQELVKEGPNQLIIAFTSPILSAKAEAGKVPYPILPKCNPPSYNGECGINMLRKMQASFAWDWGPALPSMGIWKDVHLEFSDRLKLDKIGVIITDEDFVWRLNVKAWFDRVLLDRPMSGILSVNLHQHSKVLVAAEKNVTFPANSVTGEVPITLQIPKDLVELWWPNGYGEQPLYKITAVFRSGKDQMVRSINVGFRTIELVQEPVSKTPEHGLTFYFKVNGKSIFAKGSNWIPLDILPEKGSDTEKIDFLLGSARAANFNMMRVWGGGVYESDYFYEKCDELGILLWHDFMFACSMYPTTQEFLDLVTLEVREQVQRLQHHPSIALWAANNENEAALMQNWYGTSTNFSLYRDDYIILYGKTIESQVKKIDPTRAFVTSSPSNGWKTEKDGLLSQNPQSHLYGDIHYYNYVADGWDWLTYPKARFASEYGVQSYPSHLTLMEASDPSDLTWSSDFFLSRQHLNGGNLFLLLLIPKNLPLSTSIPDFAYLSQINQAMAIKTETEAYRRDMSKLYSNGEGRTGGALYWQLNDVWQAPSWSSIDYSGRWKMLHYFARKFFAGTALIPVLTADNRLNVRVVSDVDTNQLSTLNVNVYLWNRTRTWSVILEGHFRAGEVIELVDQDIGFFTGHTVQLDPKDYFIFVQMQDHAGNGVKGVPVNFLFPYPLKDSNYPDVMVTVTSLELVTDRAVNITVSALNTALFVWLETTYKGVFSDNGFHIMNPLSKTVLFSSLEVIRSKDEFVRSLTVRNLRRWSTYKKQHQLDIPTVHLMELNG